MEFHANDEYSEYKVDEDEMNYFNVDEILNAGAFWDGEAALTQLSRHEMILKEARALSWYILKYLLLH